MSLLQLIFFFKDRVGNVQIEAVADLMDTGANKTHVLKFGENNLDDIRPSFRKF